MAHVDGAKFAMLIQADVGNSDGANAIGVGSSTRGVNAAARLALAAFVFAFINPSDRLPDPTSDEAFPTLVGRIRICCKGSVFAQGPVGDASCSSRAAPPAVVFQ